MPRRAALFLIVTAGVCASLLLATISPAGASLPPPILRITPPFGLLANRYDKNQSGHTSCGPGTWADAPVPGSFSLRSGRGGGALSVSVVGCSASSYASSYLWLGLQQLQFSVPKTGSYRITVHWSVSFATRLTIIPTGSGSSAFASSTLGVYSHWRDLTDGRQGKSLNYLQLANSYQVKSNGTLNRTVLNENLFDTFPNAHLVGGDLDQMFALSEMYLICYDNASHDRVSASMDLASPGFGVSIRSVTVTPV